MSFNSLQFAWFFPLSLLLTAWLQRRVVPRNAMLLVASYYFYGCWSWIFLTLIAASTLVDYGCGRWLERLPRPAGEPTGAHRRVVALSVLTNLGILGVFKYYDFFAGGAAELLGALGLHADLATLDLVLPVGISFYTFQSLGYTIDVYRGRLPAERNLLTFAVFVAFFPQLVAGPIERASHLLPQLRAPRPITWDRLSEGCFLVGIGLFTKVVLADNAAKVVNAVWAAPDPTGIDAWCGMLAFTVQIYCDFAGYSDIARGSARCLGFDLVRNFRAPWLAPSIAAFWRRWHISLTAWLRDYLYAPLARGRRGRSGRTVATLVTFLLCGLWHGAAWTFVVFGLIHGILLSLHAAAAPTLRRITPREGWRRGAWTLGGITLTYLAVSLTTVLFRSTSFDQAGDLVARILTGYGSGRSVVISELLVIFVVTFATMWTMHLLEERAGTDTWMAALSLGPRALGYAAMILAFIFYGEFRGVDFLYFQF